MYIYFLFIGMFGFMVQSAMVYGVNLLAMPGMQHVVYPLEYKTLPQSLLQLVFITMPRIILLEGLAIKVPIENIVHVVDACK